ncbi:DEAD/DEAH box helicase [Asticcacaulis sp. SL142]|uniref:DEAD/DEAH box helicase n=1 Tax=Asticcacaulis sp. SL142 TaxID=2995155 RepID=UPI00226CDB5C|nr:DEAD/DEAH box helicase [Asticcacaulis sp. SL142]WAC49806.1 DEAD/DEAH box helicase [Asticcacaulis sp. SL142]
MIQELSNKVWQNPAFHSALRQIEHTWLKRELGSPVEIDEKSAHVQKLIGAAAILACSEDQQHRRAAFRAATWVYELFGSNHLPLDQALRVVLARLGNYPSIGTRTDVKVADAHLPLSLLTEEIRQTDLSKLVIGGEVFHLTEFQNQLWTSLKAKKRVALAAPTSAGKSFVLQRYISALFTDPSPQIVIYIVPTRALIAQVANDLGEHLKKLGSDMPEIVTVPGDPETKLPFRAIYVMTQERVQLSLSTFPDFSAGVVIVDEAHSIADDSRGVLLQWVIDDLLTRSPSLQILFASPAIKNLELFGRLFGLADVLEFRSVEPTVAQNFLIVKVEAATKGKISVHTVGDGTAPIAEVLRLELDRTLASRVDKLVHISAILGAGQSNIVYANGAADAEKIAVQLADLFSEVESNSVHIDLSDLAKEAVHPNYVLAECVKHGVAFHYANMPTQLRLAVEAAVVSGDINYLVCTSTLLQGVNLPARNIFMCTPEKGKTHPLESTDFWNLAGRAGRLRREFQGNIFLIDYDVWKKKPLDGPKDAVIMPAIEKSIKFDSAQLFTVISDDVKMRGSDRAGLETAFVRLYSDLKRGDLQTTLNRIGILEGGAEAIALTSALGDADLRVTLPAEIVRRTPNISAHKQQRMFEYLRAKIELGEDAAKTLIPRHPRESEAYDSYAAILAICYDIVLGLDTSKNLHRFHALIALRWMRGMPLPQIIDGQIARETKKIVQTVIRDSLTLVETAIRFQAVRLFGCYNALLVYALDSAGLVSLASSIPSLPLYLEVGASDRTMISFISLGLSRVTAMKLNDLSARKDLDAQAALQWLRSRPPNSLGLSPLLLSEVSSIIA